MRIGVDVGGTKIEAIALGSNDVVMCRLRVPTPRGDYPATVEAIAGVVRSIEWETGQRGTVGVGMPGSISPTTGRIKGSNSVWMTGHAFRDDLEAALGRPVRCANDANCLAASEAHDGAAAGASVVFAAVLGTGCGGGVAIAGVVHEGGNRTAGEWGHTILPMRHGDELHRKPCFCGRAGCIETFLAGPEFESDYLAASGVRRPAAEVAALAAAGDTIADAVSRTYEDRLARALGQVVSLLDPDVIVLGGGMSNISRLYETVPPLLARHTFGGECHTPVRPAQHGDSSGVRGAARLWPA
ncbi:fructokinase [Skermanella stibiiresistens SB22]|uniref:Fructokinase n=1 Tax=Skermanella stibiiresistens SB22 TaxID=1385369 RepID=W9H2Q1_9PROT|nr:ROK family protein [Skermanella stibiiresistens]EWY39076.1 fructokinase [Skermanella stibiiresistens SB22]